jgi:hypothetical protein
MFESGMIMFTGNRAVMNKHLNAEYEQSSSNRSGDSETHVHTYLRDTDMQADSIPKPAPLYLGGHKTCKTHKNL